MSRKRVIGSLVVVGCLGASLLLAGCSEQTPMAGIVMVANGGSSPSVKEYTPQGGTSTYALAGAVEPTSSSPSSLDGPSGLALDSAGNLWVANADSSTVVEYSEAQLEDVDCAPHSLPIDCTGPAADVPVATIGDDGSGSLDSPADLAFDSTGNLWVVDAGNDTVVEYAAGQLAGLASSPSPTPALTLDWSGLSAGSADPTAIAFDSSGNLWVAAAGLSEFDTKTLVACEAGPQPCSLPADVSVAGAGLTDPVSIAFDASGDLWVANLGCPTNGCATSSIVEYLPAQLVTGSPTPATTITDDGDGNFSNGPAAIAFDPWGNLWATNLCDDLTCTDGTGSLMEYTPSQLASGGTLTPSQTETGNGLDYPDALVAAPAEATTLSVTASANPAAVGQQVTYTATINPPAVESMYVNDGTVAFSDNGAAITGCGSVGVVEGLANCPVTYGSIGTNDVVATYSGDDSDSAYDFAPSVSSTYEETVTMVGSEAQTVSFNSDAPTDASVGGDTYTPVATSDSDLPVALSLDPSSLLACTMSAGVVSFTEPGTCTIDADQSGDPTYAPATTVQQSFSVAAATGTTPQTVSFSSVAPTDASVGGDTYTPVATSDSELPVILTVDASTSTDCAISAGVVSFTGIGTCTIDADQFGDPTYAPATQVQQSFSVAAAIITTGTNPQTVSFNSDAPPDASVGGDTYTPVATSGSGLTVALSVDSSSSTVCTISAGVVSFIGGGTCTIDANQSGDSIYAPATQVQQSFSVAAASSPPVAPGTTTTTTVAPSTTTTVAPTTTTTAPRPVRPIVRVMTKSATVVQRAASLTLGCKVAACQGNIKLWYHNALLGARSYSLAAGNTGTFSTYLSHTAMHLLAKAKHHTLTVGATATASGGVTNRVQVRLAS